MNPIKEYMWKLNFVVCLLGCDTIYLLTFTIDLLNIKRHMDFQF